MADSYNKKEREKKKRKRKKDKQARKEQRKQEGSNTEEFMYVDANGNLTSTPPDPAEKKKINAKLTENWSSINNYRNNIIEKRPNLFVADIFKAMKEPEKMFRIQMPLDHSY